MLSGKTRDSLTFGPWRRRRRMRRLLARLDRAELRAARHSRVLRDTGRRVTAGVIAVLLAVIVVGTVAEKRFGLTVTAHGLHRDAPLGRPPKVLTGAGSFAFMQTQPDSDRPVAYDPCRPIHFVVNDRLGPADGQRLLDGALDTISAATGLRFVDDGTTEDLPHRQYRDPGLARQPVLVAWTTPRVVPQLLGRVAGVGGSTPVIDDYTGEARYVTGQVALDAPQLLEVVHRPGGAGQVQAIITHELGHLVGLAHVDDPHELMYPENRGQLGLGPGDREGLAALGSGRCFH